MHRMHEQLLENSEKSTVAGNLGKWIRIPSATKPSVTLPFLVFGISRRGLNAA